jgi:hypothetical protein
LSELAVTLLRLSYLVLLWLFLIAVLFVLRRDIYGTRITRRASRRDRRLAYAAAPGAGPRGAAHDAGRPGWAGSHGSGVPQPGGAAPAARLVVVSGQLKGTSLPLGPAGIVIGRSSACNLVLDDEYTSARHAQIMPAGAGWVVEDLGSTNGTFVGRERITAPVALGPGTQVRIGQTRLELDTGRA